MRTGTADVLEQIDRLKDAALKVDELVLRDQVVLSDFGYKKLALICGKCDGAFTVEADGIKCRACGQLIKIKWPDGVKPSIKLLHYFLRAGITPDDEEQSGAA